MNIFCERKYQLALSSIRLGGVCRLMAGGFFVLLLTSQLINAAVCSSVATVSPSCNQTNCQNASDLVVHAQRLAAEWRRPSLELAVSEYVKAADCFERNSNTGAAADSLKAAGDIYFILSDYKAALDLHNRALALRRVNSNKSEEAGALADLAYDLVFSGEKEQALKHAEESLALSQTLNEEFRQAQSHCALGLAQLLTGDSIRAQENANRALALAKQSNNQEILARSLLLLGYVHNDHDDLEASLSFYNQALEKWRAIHNRWGESRTLTSIGLAQTLLGDRQAALDALEATLPVLEEMGDRQSQAAALNNLAYVYQTLNELGPALEYYSQALEIYKQMKFVLGQAVSLQYCADIHAFMGNTDKAIATYNEAVQLSREVANPLLTADGLNSLGSIYFTRGDRQRAIGLFEQSLAEYRKGNHWRGQASALSNIGFYYETLPDPKKAKEAYSEAVTFARSAQDRETASSILYNLARVEMANGSITQARAHIEESLKLNEASRAKVADQDLRVSYFASVHQHYELYIDLLMQLHKQQPNDGFDVMALQASEKARARSLLELLSQTGVNVAKNTEPALREREQELRRALNQEYLKSPDTAAHQVRSLELEYEDVTNKIRASNFRYASLYLPASLDLRDVRQSLLDSKTAILEYSLGEKRSFLWVLTAGSVKTYELPPRAELEAELKSLVQTLVLFGPDAPVTNKRTTPAELENAYWKQAEKVSSLIFKDALNDIAATRLVIIGDGVLESAPFAALSRPQAPGSTNTQPQPLIKEFEVVNLPSISVMTVLSRQVAQRQPPSGSVAVFADPVFEANDARLRSSAHAAESTSAARGASISQSRALDRALKDSTLEKGIRRLVFSRREAEAISSVAPGAFVALDFRANRAAVLSKNLSNYKIVHFATHGILNDKHPELSGILLAMVDEKGKPQDGFIQLSDIYNLNLPAELVVLSACETGLGKSVKGEGLIGLTRGFMYAGASRVLGSLWKVDDAATAALMADFYKEMFTNGKRPADALRAAQLHLFEQRRWQSPYYWAGFVLQGDWR